MRMVVLAGACSVVLLAGGLRGSQAPAAPGPRPLLPAAANSISADPDAYYGQVVTLFASVDRIVSPTSFVVDQDPKGSAARGVLVLVTSLNGALTLNQYVTVLGEVVRHEGQPAIRATSVITAAGVDLAKVLPPPMSAEETVFDAAMKAISPAFTAMRQVVANAGGDQASAQAAVLLRAFDEVEIFWKKRGPAETHAVAARAKRDAAALQQAVKAGNWDAAKAAAASLQQTCSTCHAAHRERLDDGTYRIRSGAARGN